MTRFCDAPRIGWQKASVAKITGLSGSLGLALIIDMRRAINALADDPAGDVPAD